MFLSRMAKIMTLIFYNYAPTSSKYYINKSNHAMEWSNDQIQSNKNVFSLCNVSRFTTTKGDYRPAVPFLFTWFVIGFKSA